MTRFLVQIRINFFIQSNHPLKNFLSDEKFFVGFFLLDGTSKKFPFKYARIATDATATFIGFILGSIVGVGTLIMACGTGPLVNFFNENFTRPMIYKR